MKTWIASLTAGPALLLTGAAPVVPNRSGDQALIITATNYPDRIATPMFASYNDAALTARTLLGKGFAKSNVHVLADSPTPELLAARGNPRMLEMPAITRIAGSPTRAAILANLKKLAASARSGGRVVIALSGHGMQQEALGKDEADGLDGVFLPIDTGPANADQRIANAITDDELAAAVGAIRRKGATVIVFLSFSHSGEFIDDLERTRGRGALTGVADAPAGQESKQYMLPRDAPVAERAANSVVLGYAMHAWARLAPSQSLATVMSEAETGIRRHRVPPLVMFGDKDRPIL